MDQAKLLAKEEHIHTARKKFFSEPLLAHYSIQWVSEEILWQSFSPEQYLFKPSDLYFEPKKLLNSTQRAKLELLKLGQDYMTDSILVKDPATETAVLLYHGYQKSFDSYYMQFSAVHPDYRNKGIYSAFLRCMLGYTEQLGFSTVLSCHSPANNAVLIAKLKQGFKISSMEIDGHMGLNVWLTYFHNKTLEQAFLMRAGHICFDQAMADASYGTAKQLYKQLACLNL